MSGMHAKPLSRRDLRRRARITKWAVGTMSALLLGGLVACSLTLPGAPVAMGVPARSPSISRPTEDPAAASRSADRAALSEDNTVAVSVDSTGTWKLNDDHIDVDSLTVEKQPEPATATDEAANQTRATEQTVTLLNTVSADATLASHPTTTGDSGNAYPWGQCTWWAYVRRHQLDLPVGSYFGDGRQWADSAMRLGYTVNTTPTVGAIIVFQPGQDGADGTYGHVAIVEQVHEDGSITISESNAQGLGVISNRTFTTASRYTYIQ